MNIFISPKSAALILLTLQCYTRHKIRNIIIKFFSARCPFFSGITLSWQRDHKLYAISTRSANSSWSTWPSLCKIESNRLSSALSVISSAVCCDRYNPEHHTTPTPYIRLTTAIAQCTIVQVVTKLTESLNTDWLTHWLIFDSTIQVSNINVNNSTTRNWQSNKKKCRIKHKAMTKHTS